MRRERGSAAIELVIGTGFLVLPIVLLVLSLPAWAQTQMMARTAAREAARTVVLSADPTAAAALESGRVAAATVARNHGRALVADPRFDWEHEEVAGPEGTVSQPRVAVTVTVEMPGLAIPLIGEWTSFEWTVVHREPLDVYRSRG